MIRKICILILIMMGCMPTVEAIMPKEVCLHPSQNFVTIVCWSISIIFSIWSVIKIIKIHMENKKAVKIISFSILNLALILMNYYMLVMFYASKDFKEFTMASLFMIPIDLIIMCINSILKINKTEVTKKEKNMSIIFIILIITLALLYADAIVWHTF